MSRTRRFIDNARWLSVINLSQSILALAVSIVLARTILPGAFGKFAYMLALAEGLSLLTGFGINTSILQNNRHPDREFRNTGFFLSIALVLGYTVVALPVGLLLVPELIYPYLLVVAGKAVFMGSGVHGVLLQKDFKFKYFSLIQFGAFLVTGSHHIGRRIVLFWRFIRLVVIKLIKLTNV